MGQTLGYGTAASSTGVTTLSTSLGGMSGLVPPPQGISIWDPFQWKVPIPWQPVTSPPYKPPSGRAEWLKAALSMRGLVPQAPQMAPAICQPPLLSWSSPANPYQQMVHPPARMLGLGVTFDSSATKPAPTGSQDTDVYGSRLPEAKTMAVGLPAIPGEDRRGPLPGRPISRCLARRMDVQLGHLIISLHPPPQVLRGLPLTL